MSSQIPPKPPAKPPLNKPAPKPLPGRQVPEASLRRQPPKASRIIVAGIVIGFVASFKIPISKG